MPRNDSVTHLTIPREIPAGSALLSEIRTHGSKSAGLEFANDHGERYVAVRPGETLADAIARRERETSAAQSPSKPAGRPVVDRPQA